MGSIDNTARGSSASEPIAIIGMSAKFAGDATNTDNLWRMLIEGRSGWSPFPDSRFRSEGVYHPNNERLNSTHVKGAHFLAEDVGLFDAAFFGYSGETAASMDPQYRLQLESVYEALENAGLPLTKIAGSNTSVFTGVFVHDYRDGLLRDADNLPRLMATGTGVPMMANRVSHFFDLRGASMTIETACSSGMVAVHQAVQSLRTGEADMSIVGGANLTLNPDMFKALGSAGFLSADGKSYAFDSRASGYGRGEGVGTLVVKRLSDALAAGDPIRAVIRESMLNQDGKTETITSPSLEAQEALVRGCYQKAGLDPRETQYFEAHGTGTQAGDTIEAQGIATVFASRQEPLLIGSIKTNVGHTEAASGLASIIKTALAMENGVIPPSINFEKPNPKISLDDWNLKLVREVETWPAGPIRRASINNFGYGGSNAHIILEDSASWVKAIGGQNGRTNGFADGHSNGPNANGHHSTLDPHVQESQVISKVLVLSGKDKQACEKMTANLADYLRQTQSTNSNPRELLDSLIYTLGQRRSRFPWVVAHPIPVTEGYETVVQTLQSPKFKPTRTSRRPRIGMVFTGQGAQWNAMGRELIEAYPVFKASLQEAAGYLEQFGAEWSLMDELMRDAEKSRINEVGLSTPICVAVQISLVRLLRAWGIVPVAVTSHSSGEIAAAYSAGAVSYKTAMAFSYYRAVLAADKSLRGPVKGGMIAVGLGLEETESYLRRLSSEGQAAIACINSPSSITVSGDLSAVVELEDLANADGVFARRLKVDTAWHSHHMTPIANVYCEALENTRAEKIDRDALTTVAFSSPVTGGRITDAQQIARPEHWVESLVQPVQFVAAFTDMVLGGSGSVGSNVDVVVEVGPHTALGGPIQEILGLPEFKDLNIPYYGTLVRKLDARDSMHALASSLLREGYPVNMGAVNFAHGRGQYVKVLTNLPSYPWNHQAKHWAEPRLNRAIRERSQPPHDLLGSIVEGSNPNAPSWRHILRMSESPWTRDHAIQSNVIYPAAGYICLAIEASRQLHVLNQTAGEIGGYRLRDVDFLQALMIPDSSDGIEIQTTIRPVSEKDIASQGWRHFEVWSVTTDNRWTQHAKGLVSVELGESSVRMSRPARKNITGYTRRILPADLFANLRNLGITHGPVFQNMDSIIQSGSEMRSVVSMTLPDVSVPNDLPRNHILHPVTLDSVITAPYSAVPGAAAREITAKVPRSVERFWVSSKISHDAGHSLEADTTLIRDDDQGMAADVLVSDHDTGNIMLEMNGFSYQSLGRSTSLQKSESWPNELCNKVVWSLDISTPLPATLAAVRNELACTVQSAECDTTKATLRACIYFMQLALVALDSHDIAEMEQHNASYYTWMKDTVELASSGKLFEGSAEWLYHSENERQLHIEQVQTRLDGEIVCRLGTQLVDILRGHTGALDLVMQDNLLSRFYSYAPRWKRAGTQIAGLLRHLSHKNPRARILEVGAATGAIALHALGALGTSDSGGPNASMYHFTDTSTALFETARESLQPWADLLSFDELDIEHDPASQGYTPGTYDIVIASNIRSISESTSQALSNISSLLKPGGTLLLVEPLKYEVDVHFVRRLLPGRWWDDSTELKANLCLDMPSWENQLLSAGFTGVELELLDREDPQEAALVTFMSTVQLPQPPKSNVDADQVVIVTSRNGCPPAAWVKGLKDAIAAYTVSEGKLGPIVQDLESLAATAASYADKICIFLGEVDEGILYNLNSTLLEGIRSMSTNSKGLIWVTRGGAVDCERPEMSLATGFIRSLRNEYVGRKLLTLDLDPKGTPWSDVSMAAIAKILGTVIGNSAGGSMVEKGAVELEYAERDGVILIPRIYHDVTRNRMLSPDASDAAMEKISIENFYQPTRPLCLKPDLLVFGDDDFSADYLEHLPPASLEVQPKAYGATLNSVGDHIAGFECAGIITQVGEEAAAQGYAVGDRVLSVLRHSSFPSRAVVDWKLTTRMPTDMTFQEGASLPLSFLSAYFALVEIARLQRSRSVLIHAGAGDVGQAAIMVAQHLGAEVYVTVGSPAERGLLILKYGLPADHIFSCTDLSLANAVVAATQGRGVDVVLNSLTGPLFQESLNLVAPLGHFVEIGRRNTQTNGYMHMRPFDRGISFATLDIPSLLEYRAMDVHRCLAELTRLIELKAVTPVHPITFHAIGEIAEASRLLKAGDQIGKVVLSVDEHSTVTAVPSKPAAKLSSEVSYLIVGGSGGLAQSVAHWMVNRGARNLVLLSRSAGTSEKTAAFAEDLRQAGCRRVLPISCDVANEESLGDAINQCAQEGLPPIRGIIHAAFVLRDAFVEKMTLDDWTYTIQSKVAGTWNLHNQFNLPGDLDFFVLFSSINGILGYASQSAYSAAGAYEDALAHWRVKHCGLPAVSIDLSVVNAVGYVAEANASETLRRSLLRAGRRVIDEDHVLGSLESAILSPFDPQFVVGGINSGPGPHWDLDGDLGRDMRVLPLKYRPPAVTGQSQDDDSSSDSLAAKMIACESQGDAVRVVGTAIAEMLAEMFLVPIEDVDLGQSPSQQGVDSLVAVEVRNMLFSQAGAEVSIFNIMQSPSLTQLAIDVVDRSAHVKLAG
ncbi:t1pks [Penicillium rubens]|uniref:Polyketide synthase n=1 Tax=Penicillium chrysogenum TaxID=5076 RepID=A0A142LXN4_PENCH|nr:uncharacterized protein N7525_006989 [Penicillium rubens]AMS38560.1 polyketide synthase [Penicillium chrysogenum]KAF3028235.1 t1pks [Penicillium rubens]KAJ5828736.1 hypothetical protein N7525_006989 [Penicillium rubens]KZN88281.1 Polyketide synthase [Penicillium chrysogenum]